MKRQPGEFNHFCQKCRKVFRDKTTGVCGDKPLCPKCIEAMSPEELQAHRVLEGVAIQAAKRRRKKR